MLAGKKKKRKTQGLSSFSYSLSPLHNVLENLIVLGKVELFRVEESANPVPVILSRMINITPSPVAIKSFAVSRR